MSYTSGVMCQLSFIAYINALQSVVYEIGLVPNISNVDVQAS